MHLAQRGDCLKLDLKKKVVLVFKEIVLALVVVSLLKRLALSCLSSIKNFYLSVIVVLAEVISLASIWLLFVPLIIKTHHPGSALASAIFITTATDVLGICSGFGA